MRDSPGSQEPGERARAVNLENLAPLKAGCTMGLDTDGRERIVCVAKATFDISTNGREPVFLDDQEDLIVADEFVGEPGFSAPVRESDYAPMKSRCDVLLGPRARRSGHATGPVKEVLK